MKEQPGIRESAPDSQSGEAAQIPGGVLVVGGFAVGAFFTGSILAGQIANKFEEVASYPAAAASFAVCIYGLKRLVDRLN